MLNNKIGECRKLAQKKARLVREDDPLGIVQEINIWPNYQIE